MKIQGSSGWQERKQEIRNETLLLDQENQSEPKQDHPLGDAELTGWRHRTMRGASIVLQTLFMRSRISSLDDSNTAK